MWELQCDMLVCGTALSHLGATRFNTPQVSHLLQGNANEHAWRVRWEVAQCSGLTPLRPVASAR